MPGPDMVAGDRGILKKTASCRCCCCMATCSAGSFGASARGGPRCARSSRRAAAPTSSSRGTARKTLGNSSNRSLKSSCDGLLGGDEMLPAGSVKAGLGYECEDAVGALKAGRDMADAGLAGTAGLLALLGVSALASGTGAGAPVDPLHSAADVRPGTFANAPPGDGVCTTSSICGTEAPSSASSSIEAVGCVACVLAAVRALTS